MKIRIVAVLAAVSLISLGGCATEYMADGTALHGGRIYGTPLKQGECTTATTASSTFSTGSANCPVANGGYGGYGGYGYDAYGYRDTRNLGLASNPNAHCIRDSRTGRPTFCSPN